MSSCHKVPYSVTDEGTVNIFLVLQNLNLSKDNNETNGN